MIKHVVRCPHCKGVLTRVYYGMFEQKCPNKGCGKVVEVMCNGDEVRIGRVDTPRRDLRESA